MDRKTFIKRLAGTMAVSIPVVTLLGCSDSDDVMTPSANVNCLDNGTQISVGANHGHSLTVPKEDVMAGTQKEYNIQGSSVHNHKVVVTDTDFTTLRNNQQIQVASSSDLGHTHLVTISCA